MTTPAAPARFSEAQLGQLRDIVTAGFLQRLRPLRAEVTGSRQVARLLARQIALLQRISAQLEEQGRVLARIERKLDAVIAHHGEAIRRILKLFGFSRRGSRYSGKTFPGR